MLDKIFMQPCSFFTVMIENLVGIQTIKADIHFLQRIMADKISLLFEKLEKVLLNYLHHTVVPLPD